MTTRKHGHKAKRSATYITWVMMKQRCTNPKAPDYRRYGGRGIRVCDRWMDFASFLEDMGERPEGMTLDRINNEMGYEPGNCKWSTHKEQCANKRTSVILNTPSGPMCMAQAARAAGLSVQMVKGRRVAGWDVGSLLSPPTRKRISVSYNGKTLLLPEWSKETGIPLETLRGRVKRGLPPEQVLSTSRLAFGTASGNRYGYKKQQGFDHQDTRRK